MDSDTRSRLMHALSVAADESAKRLEGNALGDYRADQFVGRFPAWEPLRPAGKPSKEPEGITATDLFTRWEKGRGSGLARSTVARYGASWRSFIAFVKDRDTRTLADADVYAWAEHRRDMEGVSARVVNKNDLVAVSSIFKWASGLSARKLLTANPASGVHLDAAKLEPARERTFRAAEVSAILKAADAVTVDADNPTFSYAKRWCPWLAAYSGARIAELTNLSAEDVRDEAGVPVMDIRRTKTGVPRTVPLHVHLIEMGFLDFVQDRGTGPLFFDPRRNSDKAKTHPSTSRGSKLGRWVRSVTALDKNVDPNHGWRHTFKTRALGAGIDARLRDAITGHSAGSVARGYEAPPVSMLAEAMARFPRYKLG